MATRKNTKKTNSKKTARTSTKKRAPRGNAGAAATDTLKTTGEVRSRETSKKKKGDEKDKPLFNIYEVTLPDKTKVQRRFAVGKSIEGVIMARLASDKKWYVLLWTAEEAERIEKRCEKIAAWHVDEKHPKFKEKLYLELKANTSVKVVEKNTRSKVTLVEDRSGLNISRGKAPKAKAPKAEKPVAKKETSKKETSKKETSKKEPAKKRTSKKKAATKKTTTKKPVA